MLDYREVHSSHVNAKLTDLVVGFLNPKMKIINDEQKAALRFIAGDIVGAARKGQPLVSHRAVTDVFVSQAAVKQASALASKNLPDANKSGQRAVGHYRLLQHYQAHDIPPGERPVAHPKFHGRPQLRLAAE